MTECPVELHAGNRQFDQGIDGRLPSQIPQVKVHGPDVNPQGRPDGLAFVTFEEQERDLFFADCQGERLRFAFHRHRYRSIRQGRAA